MTLLASKWIVSIVVVLLVGLIGLYLVGRKSAHSEITIEASPGEIWSVLTDVQNIKEWNPVLIPIEGELKEGETLKYEFHQDENNISVMPATVKRMVEGKLLNQSGGMPGVLTFDHKYTPEPVDGGTKVIIHEDYRGIAVPFWDPTPVEAAYARLNAALRDRVVAFKQHQNGKLIPR